MNKHQVELETLAAVKDELFEIECEYRRSLRQAAKDRNYNFAAQIEARADGLVSAQKLVEQMIGQAETQALVDRKVADGTLGVGALIAEHKVQA